MLRASESLWGEGGNVGHWQRCKQTTCFLPRSRVVNVDRNRCGQPCGWIRRGRANGELGKIARHHRKVCVCRWSSLADVWAPAERCQCSVLDNRVNPPSSFCSSNKMQVYYFSFKPPAKHNSGLEMVTMLAEGILKVLRGCINNDKIDH